jgi:CIC family chloride channel protein
MTKQGTRQTWILTDARGVVGLLTREQLEKAASLENPGIPVRELLHGREFPHVHTDHSLDDALDRMGANRVDVLPVVSRANIHELLGVVRLQDVLESYGVGLKARA